MISERRRTANRANAARSTGPRTAEGKARSSRNATTHGLCAARIVLSQEEADRYEQRLAEWEADFRPADEVERDLVARAVFATVVIDRIDLIAAEGDDAPFDPARDRVVRRHGGRWSRILQRALDDLRRHRSGPDRTNPMPQATAPRADSAARPNEPADRPDAATEATEPIRPNSFLRAIYGEFSGSLLVAAVLVLGLLATPLGHEPDTNGRRTGHDRDTTGRRRDTSGRRRDTSGRRRDRSGVTTATAGGARASGCSRSEGTAAPAGCLRRWSQPFSDQGHRGIRDRRANRVRRSVARWRGGAEDVDQAPSPARVPQAAWMSAPPE